MESRLTYRSSPRFAVSGPRVESQDQFRHSRRPVASAPLFAHSRVRGEHRNTRSVHPIFYAFRSPYRPKQLPSVERDTTGKAQRKTADKTRRLGGSDPTFWLVEPPKRFVGSLPPNGTDSVPGVLSA